jgi:hypothetical protein
VYHNVTDKNNLVTVDECHPTVMVAELLVPESSGSTSQRPSVLFILEQLLISNGTAPAHLHGRTQEVLDLWIG